MSVFFTIFTVLLVASLAPCFYMLARNEWVFRWRRRIIDRSLEEYHRLPSYDDMMKKWWVWNINKFLK